MVREFELPDVGEGVAEGELVSWLVESGETVSEDQPVAEVETDKALVEVPAPVNGTVRELHFEEGDVIPVGDVFVTFDVDGEDGATDAPAEEAAETPDSAAETDSDSDSDTEPAGDPGATGAGDDTEPAETPDDRIFAPPRVRRMARDEGIDLSQLRGSGPGGRITAADVQAAAGTAPSGTAQAAAGADEGAAAETTADATEGAPAADSSSGTETAAGSSGQTATATQTQPPTQVDAADRDRTLAAPATRRIAREEGVDLDAVPATEERDGEAFVTPDAVQEYADAQRQAQEADAAALEAGEAVGETAGEFAEGQRERREPFRGVRKTIADAMVESKFSAPHVTHHDEVDVTELVEARERLKTRAEDQGIRLTYMPFIMKAVVAALKQHPQMNAVIDEANEEIVHRNYYNIGVATATDVGLMVPVVDDADGKGLLQLSSEMNELISRARDRSISPDELRGSTFTITNIGGIGGEYATPILNYPESGILAIGEIKRKPRVVTDEHGDESIEPRSVLTLSVSFDHRLIDGADGARFTNTVMEYLENPDLLLLE
ncbi:2-oxo acid dehydrogenase subunit E2 [Natrialba aegyptia]|uniref:Branched-chain alpha-keto acid dehydrogenase subunit E2 n=1 Tax=Natrialba aegyptia DSM 13077 TaxID=1227491 RepID=M0B4X0_9EURY|nr:2-oxo acid dehydrogenase subunit E2 [Natrialba aegyptia]ELZ05870.1 branched-chain alpha-keto acid dehydrogenase subunit E2 [Natrialba aegyptia DSM 13077]